MQMQRRLARYAGSRRRVNFGSPTDEPATAPGSCYAARPPILQHTRPLWRSRTISRPASKGSWRENRVSRRSSSAEALAPRQLTPPRRLNLSRMRRREPPPLGSRAGNETLSRAPLPPVSRFERRASNPFATQTQGLLCKRYRLTAVVLQTSVSNVQ